MQEEESERFTGCYCAAETSRHSEELYLELLNCTSEENMLFNPQQAHADGVKLRCLCL